MLVNGKTVGVKDLARWFINHADRESGESITPLKLQKLIYYADAWFLANFDRPLIKEEFEAWAHGPAVRSIYAKYRGYQWNSLPSEEGRLPKEELQGFLEAVYEEYGQYSAKKLEQMTHEEDPWLRARGNLPPEAASKNVISKLEIRNFYAKRLGKKEIKYLRD
jgi:uncharacterized phage-associated protein